MKSLAMRGRCATAASALNEIDTGRFDDAFEFATKHGQGQAKASLSAVADAIAQLASDRAAFVKLAREQHPEVFAGVAAGAVRAEVSRETPAAAEPEAAAESATPSAATIVSGRGPDLVTLYHGTSDEGFASIQAEGVIQGGSYFGVTGSAVALSPSRKAAEEYSQGGPVIEVRVPRSSLVVDPESNDNPSADDALRQGKSVFALGNIALRSDATPSAAEPPAPPKTLRERAEGMKAPATKTPTVDAHLELFKAVRGGTATPEAFKAMYARVRDGRDAIVAELNTNTKDELLSGISRGAYIRPSTTKGELVEAIYKGLLSRFALGKDYGPSSYMMGREKAYEQAKRDAFDALVEGQTAESLSEYAAELKAEFDAAMTARAARLEAIKDPKTLDEFAAFTSYHMREGKTQREIRFMMTPEQRALADDLWATDTRGKRLSTKDEQRTAVRAAGQTTAGEIIATKHTRDGHDLWVVKLSDRVSKDDYTTLLAGAKRMGGNYSSYRGGGAIPGFQFRTRDAADAFLKLAGGDTAAAQTVAVERRDSFQDDRSQSASERLTEMADRLEERADESLGRERNANTARRASFAASAEASAQSDKALAKTMRNIADAITGGAAKFLDRVRQKAQVEMMQGYVRSAKDAELRAKHESYHEQEKHKGERPTGETADYAEFPTFTAYRSDLASLGRQLLEVDGTKRLGEQIMKVADDVSDAYLAFAKDNFFKVGTFSSKSGGVASFGTRDAAEAAIKRSGYKGKAIAYQVKRGEHTVIMSPSEAIAHNIWQGDGDKRITLDPDVGAELVEKIGRAARRGAKVSVPWQFEAAYDRRKALARMGIEMPAEFRAALREFIGLREQAAAPDKVKQMERAMIGRRNDGLDFFPTPEETADAMVEAADIQPGMRVLEPSAGMGHIAERIRAAEVEPDVGEVSSNRRELLEAKGFNVVAQDFMAMQEGGYDRILMNPPFSDGRDIQHVRHAYDLLKPGGRLVALMGESAFTNQNKRATEFREWLESVGGTEEKLPEGTFNDPSLPVNTGANARMVVIEKTRTDDAGNVAMFSRIAGHSRGLSLDDAEAAADLIRAAFKKGPQIYVLEDVRKSPKELLAEIRKEGAENDVEAVYWRGAIYAYPQHMADLDRLMFVLGHHEIRHAGFDAVFGKNRGMMMMGLGMKNADLMAQARERVKASKRGGGHLTIAGAVEEVLADMPVEQMEKLTGWDRIVSAIRQWLRDTAASLRDKGHFAIADAIDPKEWTDRDLAHLVLKAEHISRAGGSSSSVGGTMFDRSKPAQTDTPAFLKWFGASKVVDADGAPLVVYHGTRNDITAFDPEKVGARFSASAGFYFTSRPSGASLYADGLNNAATKWEPGDKFSRPVEGGANVMPAYVALKNPLELSTKDFSAERMLDGNKGEIVRKARTDGYDGIIVRRDVGDEFDGVTVVAFRPEQIKSATGNSGAFDPANPDIRYSRKKYDPMVNATGRDDPRPVSATKAEIDAAHYARARIQANDGVASPDDLAAMLRVPGYSQRAQSPIAGDVDAIAALRAELAELPVNAYQRPAVNAQGIIDIAGATLAAYKPEQVDALTALTDAYGVPIVVRGHFGSHAESMFQAKRFQADGFVFYTGMTEPAGRRGGAMIQYIRPAGTIGQNTPLFSRAPATDSEAFRDDDAQWPALEKSRLASFVYRVQDKHIDLKDVQSAIKETDGSIRDEINAYLKEELFHGRAATRIKEFLDGELKPLITAMQAHKVTQEDLGLYLWAKHAREANEHIASINPDNPDMQDGGSGMTNEDADSHLAGLSDQDRATYEALAARVYAMTAATRAQLVADGLLSEADKATWERAYQFYVPLNREDMDTMAHGNGTGQGFSIRGKESKRRVGSKRAVTDIIGNIANQRDQAVVRGEKNRVGLALYGLAMENPNPDFWKLDSPPVERVVEKTKPVYRVVDESTGVELDRFDSQTDAKTYSIRHPGTAVKRSLVDQVVERIDPLYKSKDNVVMVKIANPATGKIEERSILFNERNERAVRMAAALKNLDGTQLGELLGAAAKVTRYFASINTQYNPIFGIVNLIRDVQGAMLNLTNTPLAGKQGKILTDTWAILRGSAKHGMRGFDGEWAALAKEFEAAGGQTAYRDMFRTGKERSESIQKALDPEWWTKTAWGKTITANGYLERPMALLLDKGAKPVLSWLTDYNSTMENAVRLAAFKEARAANLSVEQAASLAKNLTVNFNRKGEMAMQAGALYAFFNASVQGMTRMGQTLTGPAGKRIIYGGITLGAMQALALAAAGFDDDEPPDFVRERNLILPIGDKKYLTLPMPLGFNVLPNIGRLSMELMLSGGKKPGKKIGGLLGVLVDATNPLGGSAPLAQIISPTITDPLVALGMNKDWTGKPIAREDMSGLNQTPGFTRSRDVSSAPAKWVAEAINTLSGGTKYKPGIASPTADQIEYLVGQVTGGVGREIGKIATTVETAVTGEELPPYKMPLLGRFYGSSEGQAAQGNAFYANLKELNGHEATIKGLRKEGKARELAEYLRDNPDAKLIALANKAERRVSELRKRKRELAEREDGPKSTRLLDHQITNNMKILNDAVREAGQ